MSGPAVFWQPTPGDFPVWIGTLQPESWRQAQLRGFAERGIARWDGPFTPKRTVRRNGILVDVPAEYLRPIRGLA